MSTPLLTKDAINIGGHKLPLPVVGALVGVLGLVIVLRARSQGGSVVQAGSAPGPVSLDTSAQNSQDLANLGIQLAGIQSQLSSVNAPATTPAPTPTVLPIVPGGGLIPTITPPGWGGLTGRLSRPVANPPGTGIPGFIEG